MFSSWVHSRPGECSKDSEAKMLAPRNISGSGLGARYWTQMRDVNIPRLWCQSGVSGVLASGTGVIGVFYSQFLVQELCSPVSYWD